MHKISGAEKQCKCTCGKRYVDRSQQVFVILDFQIGVQAALQQNAGAAERDHFLDFFENRLEREHVSLF